MSDSDQHLIDQFRTTGQIAFLNTLLERHLAKVRATVFQMLLDDDAADDVTQDVFLRVIRGIEKFEGRAEFSTWLFRITWNAVRARINTQKQSHVRSLEEFSCESPVDKDTPTTAVLQTELTSDIQNALAILSPTLRAAIVLVCIQGQTPADAAEIEGCTIDTMYWRVHEGRQQLKKLLAEHLK